MESKNAQKTHANQFHSEDENLTIIFNDAEFLEHIYNRYSRIRVETLIDVLELLNSANTLQGAVNIITAHVSKEIFNTSMNFQDITEMQSRVYKRGNPRKRSRVGL